MRSTSGGCSGPSTRGGPAPHLPARRRAVPDAARSDQPDRPQFRPFRSRWHEVTRHGTRQRKAARHRPFRSRPDLRRTVVAAHGDVVPAHDEFFGNLYHLNAEEEPEMDDYPKEDFPSFKKTSARAASSIPGRPTRTTNRAAALGQGRQAEDRGHRPAHQEAHGDLRRRIRRRGHGLHQAAEQGRQAVLRVAQHHAHAPVHAHQEGEPRPGRPLAVAVSRHDDRPRQERRPDARSARRARHRRRHLRACTRPTTVRTGTPGRMAA